MPLYPIKLGFPSHPYHIDACISRLNHHGLTAQSPTIEPQALYDTLRQRDLVQKVELRAMSEVRHPQIRIRCGVSRVFLGCSTIFSHQVREYMQNNSGITGHRQLRGASGNQAGLGRASEVSQRFALRLCQGVPKAWAWTRFGDAMQLHQGRNTFGEVVFRDAIWPGQMFDHLVVCPHTSFIHVSFLLRPHNGSIFTHFHW